MRGKRREGKDPEYPSLSPQGLEWGEETYGKSTLKSPQYPYRGSFHGVQNDVIVSGRCAPPLETAL